MYAPLTRHPISICTPLKVHTRTCEALKREASLEFSACSMPLEEAWGLCAPGLMGMLQACQGQLGGNLLTEMVDETVA